MLRMITRRANNPENFSRRLTFLRSGRVAWEHILKQLRMKPRQSILLPAYIGITDREGSGIIDPVEATDTPYTLYELGDRLQVDLSMIERRLQTGRHPLMLVVHYFGIVHAEMDRLSDLCRQYGTILIEDCAHVVSMFEAENATGAFGEGAFYSIHKSIAVNEGGILRLNGKLLETPSISEQERCPVEVLEQLVRTNFHQINRIRRVNYQWLVDRLSGVSGLTILYPNIGACVPHDFPVIIHDGLREKLYFALMDEGLPTIALYYRLIDSISPAEFPASHELSKSILNLPVHQDTTIADLELLINRLKFFLSEFRK